VKSAAPAEFAAGSNTILHLLQQMIELHGTLMITYMGEDGYYLQTSTERRGGPTLEEVIRSFGRIEDMHLCEGCKVYWPLRYYVPRKEGGRRWRCKKCEQRRKNEDKRQRRAAKKKAAGGKPPIVIEPTAVRLDR
jgi:hypothetical protein